jgi:diguanylate cyclase (GGDEF)-like protein
VEILNELLSRIEIFQDLREKELSILKNRMERKEFPKGTIIFQEGDEGKEMYIVLSGSIGISVRLPDSTELPLAQIQAGNFFGEMSIIEQAPRSATCRTLEDSVLLTLGASSFYELLEQHPRVALKIMKRMVGILTRRLTTTGSLLSDMVRWGEGARKRAVIDEFTGLYNRRFLDEAIHTQAAHALSTQTSLSLVMVDLDRFGELNRTYGQEFGDTLILEASKVFRSTFREADILARYGGDEFTFILPDTDAETALSLCQKTNEALRSLSFPNHPEVRLTASIGLASLPRHARTVENLREQADKALYRAKEEGRNRSCLPPSRWPGEKREIKVEIPTLRAKNRIIEAIIQEIIHKESFLLVGHRNPDEDCIASLVAFGLLLGKFSKQVVISTCGKVPEQLSYLLNICAYNGILLHEGCFQNPPHPQVIVILDTPKPEMIDTDASIEEALLDPRVRKIEIDHHLEADAAYSGDPGFCLVSDASSTCELIGLLSLKLAGRGELLKQFGIQELFSRNFALALLTGIIGDSKMGKFLKTNKERWFYRTFSSLFDQMLRTKTAKGSSNFSSMEQVFQAIEALSNEEKSCYEWIFEKRQEREGIAYSVFDRKSSEQLFSRFEYDTVLAVTKSVADRLAELSGKVGLVGYYDPDSVSNLVQFRLRRASGYSALDLRTVLENLQIKNGGGHPGAIGFRFPKEEVQDFPLLVQEILEGIQSLLS